MPDRSPGRLLGAVAVAAAAVFAGLTALVTSTHSPSLDSTAFKIANDVRSPALDHAARIITTLGLFAIVAPVLVIGAAILIRQHHGARAAAVLIGGALAWVGVWITKAGVDRPRPPSPLVHTTGQSYPSGHAANSVGYLAVAIVLTVAIPTRRGRVAAVSAGALLALLVGLTRIYLRAHYATDVLGGETFAIAMYATAGLLALAWLRRRPAPKPTASVTGGDDRGRGPYSSSPT